MTQCRVLKYVATAKHSPDGRKDSNQFPFMLEHATEQGVRLETDGIPIGAAIDLVAKWNRLSDQTSGLFSYNIPFVKARP